MNKGRQILSWTPEILLTAETIFYWLSSSPLNPIAMTLLAILVTVFVFKNKTLAFVTSILFLLLNSFMCLALLSELNEFSTLNDNAKLMTLVGGTMLGTGIIAATAMAIKWGRQHASIMQTSN